MGRFKTRFCVVAAGLCLLPMPAYAYADPNAASFLFQIFTPLIIAVTSAWLFAKEKIQVFLTKIACLIQRRKL